MSPAPSSRGRHQGGPWLLVPGVLALVLTGLAAHGAWSTRGRPFPSLMVDAYHFYSLVLLPSWDPRASVGGLPWPSTEPLPLARHRLVAVNGESLSTHGPLRSPLELYALAGDTCSDARVSLRFEDPWGKPLPMDVDGGCLDFDEILLFFVTYVLAAWMVLWSGGLVLTLSSRPAARRAFVGWSAVTFLFLLSFYDYHTTAWLAPLFSVSKVGLMLSALWLAYAFPSPPAWRRVGLRRLLSALTVLGAATALGLVAARFTGTDIEPVRNTTDLLLAPCIAALALAVLLRLRRSTGLERAELLTASGGLIATPLLIALMQVFSLWTGREIRHLALPFIILILPLSIGYALIRHNILEARVVLTPRMLRVPLVLGALLLSVLGTYLIHLATRTGPTQLILLLLIGGALFTALMVLAHQLQVRLFFPATLAFRGTIERLSDRLAALRDAPTIRRTLEETVMQAVPTLSAGILEPSAPRELPHLPPEALEELARGTHVWTAQSPRERHLLIPMRSLGELRAVLLIAPKRKGALYTQEDLQLLETVASLGALALHNAEAVQELESLRRLEVGAAHMEKQLTLSAISEEVCHEMVYPLSFLQDLLRRGADGQPLGEEDLSFAREEVERMKRMLDSLRRLQSPRPEVGPIPLLGHAQRALQLIRESIQRKRLSVMVEIDPELTVRAEGDSLVQLLSNLLRNAAQAAPEEGSMGIRARWGAEGQLIEVWDTGPGIPEEVAQVLFTHRRVSTKQDGHGIGLTVVQRIAHNFRWQVFYLRESERTLFRLTLPPSP
ncbi:HAMP domain-containing histidine kinase [Cystobacter fuscus]|uniref:sensor histidine kinase n=1 Tax=Cystobacter fuscus TaxID=43 RepID=UPI002B2E4E0F|nr:HAMP domain-containing histidine kinase [Cystobacter fuscus]